MELLEQILLALQNSGTGVNVFVIVNEDKEEKEPEEDTAMPDFYDFEGIFGGGVGSGGSGSGITADQAWLTGA